MRNLKCYISGPIFSHQDRATLESIAAYLDDKGVVTYLPHRDTGDLGTVTLNRSEGQDLRRRIFEDDVGNIRDSGLLVALLDGQDSDSGTCVELGIAYAMRIPIFGLKTDLGRRGGVVNNMVWGVCESGRRLYVDLKSLFNALEEFVDNGAR